VVWFEKRLWVTKERLSRCRNHAQAAHTRATSPPAPAAEAAVDEAGEQAQAHHHAHANARLDGIRLHLHGSARVGSLGSF
jgi:hypothetical protein